MTAPHHLYIHVPYCASKCHYCAFYSTVCAPDWDVYADGIIKDFDKYKDFQIKTIFFGGGTPSLIPTDVFKRIMDAAYANFDVAHGAEITLESNPGTLCEKRLKEFIASGVNRLSVGVQSLSDTELKFLGRTHTTTDAIKLIHHAKDAGITISADFIYGLPRHDVNHIKKLCAEIKKLNLNHISMYELTIEENTKLAHENIVLPDNDVMADMYLEIGQHFKRYEVSNYGASCMHNSGIWDGEPYIGIGDGAHGRLFISGEWFDMNNIFISEKDRAIEKIIMGMRTAKGVLLTNDVHNAIDWGYVNDNKNLFIITPTQELLGDKSPSQLFPAPQGGRLAATDFLLLDDLTSSIINI
ncbi:MAG: radical SAM family heme chaperone HemW [Alphaproteobacteria bacterium]|nr:radical SAM family heme chaperone HemW [Alphaproteobacteria bacterium]